MFWERGGMLGELCVAAERNVPNAAGSEGREGEGC